jgi:hypothetical protein
MGVRKAFFDRNVSTAMLALISETAELTRSPTEMANSWSSLNDMSPWWEVCT